MSFCKEMANGDLKKLYNVLKKYEHIVEVKKIVKEITRVSLDRNAGKSGK
jgi:quinolinate synthase